MACPGSHSVFVNAEPWLELRLPASSQCVCAILSSSVKLSPIAASLWGQARVLTSLEVSTVWDVISGCVSSFPGVNGASHHAMLRMLASLPALCGLREIRSESGHVIFFRMRMSILTTSAEGCLTGPEVTTSPPARGPTSPVRQ